MPHEPRITAEDHEIYMRSLCLAFPPGPDRESCVREMTMRLIAIYARVQTPPPPSLLEFAQRIGVEVSTESR